MIGTAGETILQRLLEIVLELLVDAVGALCGLDHHEAHGTLVDHALIAQHLPVDIALIVRDVDAVNLIALRMVDLAIKCPPAETVGRNEEIIEHPEIAH